MFTEAHDYLIEDSHLEDVETAVKENKFTPVWKQAKRILTILVTIPFLPKKWREVLTALLTVGDIVQDVTTPVDSAAPLPELPFVQ